MTEEILKHYDVEPELPENILEMSDEEKQGFQQEYLDWLIRRIELGNFENFTQRDKFNELKTKLEEGA